MIASSPYSPVLQKLRGRRRGIFACRVLLPAEILPHLPGLLCIYSGDRVVRVLAPRGLVEGFPVNVILALCAAVASYLFIKRPFLMLRSCLPPSASPHRESAGASEALSMADSAAR
jgi:hypothetical protein